MSSANLIILQKNRARVSGRGPRLFFEVTCHKLVQQLVPVETADQAAGVVVVRDIGRVLGENVAHDLIDRVIALDDKRIVDGGQYFLHFRLAVDHVEFACYVFHAASSLRLFSIIPNFTKE